MSGDRLSAADVAYIGSGGHIPSLADRYGVSETTMYRWIRKAGIERNPAPGRGRRGPARDAKQRARVLAAVEQYGGQRPAARALGLSAGRVNQIVLQSKAEQSKAERE